MKTTFTCLMVIVILASAIGLVVTGLIFLWNLVAYLTAPWVATVMMISIFGLFIGWIWTEIDKD